MEMLEAMINDHNKGRATVSDLWEAQTKRTEYARRVLKAWAATKARTGTDREMDALLMPCTPWPACEKYGFTYDNYTSLWNVLDYCATTVPVTRVSLAEDVKPEYECRNQTEEIVWKDYQAESLIGAPVAVQLVGRRLNEEYLLGVTRACDDALRASSY
jgi:amidase